ERLRVPTECKELALTMAREHGQIEISQSLDAEEIVNLLERCDAIRKPERFLELLTACECVAKAREESEEFQYKPSQILSLAAAEVRRMDVGAIAKRAAAEGMRGPEIGKAIHSARVDALKKVL
ncbi:MAG: multifunctional CCA tRNA nucleotidyl transferase/2'3'-cyclic phosphodiesterase/2'nucleotidase/phosphatase, partial [Bacillota bacterium]